LVGIFKMRRTIKKTFLESEGSVILITILVLGVMIFLASFFITFSLTGCRISQSQAVSTRTYYLAEAGIQEAIWKLKNDEILSDGDDPWKTCFVSSTIDCPDCSSWQDSFVRNYTPDSTTTVSIENSQCAQGTINATATLSFGGNKVAQRVVKVKVIKAFGSLTEDSPLFAGAPSGESTIQASEMNIYDGNIFSNNNINIKFWSEVNVYDNPITPTSTSQEGQVLSVQNINITLSTLTSSSTCSKNFCTQGICEKCPPDPVPMPAIDFDSSQANSYKNKALQAQEKGQCSVVGRDSTGNVVLTSSKCVFSEREFEDLLWQIGRGGTLTLEHKSSARATSTYYVEGGINLRGERYLEINGILVADETVNIGERFCWKRGGESDCGFDQITINDPGKGIPSGLLTKAKINFGPYTSFREINIKGLVYSQDEMRLTSIPYAFKVIGGMVARKFSLTSAFQPLNIYLDNVIIQEAVWGGPQPPGEDSQIFSPVVTIEHWEESY